MRFSIVLLTCVGLFCSPLAATPPREDIQTWADNTDKLYRVGAGAAATDGAYTAISTSMIGWGIGLAVGIAIICALLHSSRGNSN